MPDAPAISPATASYKWPSKVLRYKITCPFQRMLVVKHEAQIDWDGQIHGLRIESAQALDAHIKDVMLPALHRWMDPGDEKSHYCRQIDLEKMLANPAPHIQEARDLRNREGDEAARRFLLDHINRQKKEQFEGWWDYVMKGNPAYQKHPAFQYLILRPVLESSDAKTTRSPLPVNAEALAHLWDRIKAGRVDPRRTKLVQLLARFMAFGDVADEEQPRFGTDCRWVVIKRTDPKAAERVAALSQGSGWCVASSSMAASYLQSSDFHLLVEDGRARVALRLAGNQAVEVQGKNNDDPGPWWPRILLYLAARGTSISHRNEQAAIEGRRIGEQLADAGRRGTQRLGEVLKEQPAKVHLLDGLVAQDDEAAQLVVREAWLSCVRADPMCGGLLPEWMEVDAEMKRAVEEAWGALLIADPLSFQDIPKAIADSPAVIQALRTGWAKMLANDPKKWSKCPEFLQSDSEIAQARKTGWARVIINNPAKWDKCPDFLQQEFQKDTKFIQSFSTRWAKLIENEPRQWESCPKFLRENADVVQANRTGWIRWLAKNLHDWHQCPFFLQQEFQKDTKVIQIFRAKWIKLLEDKPCQWELCPEFLREKADVVQARKVGWVTLLAKNPNEWKHCPESLKSSVAIVRECELSWFRLLMNDPRQWNQCPDFIKSRLHKDSRVVKKLRMVWRKLLEDAPDRWKMCPDFLQGNPEFINDFKRSLIRRMKFDPKEWNRCPDLFTELEKNKLFVTLKQEWFAMLGKGQLRLETIPVFLWNELKQDAELMQKMKSSWLDLLEKQPRMLGACPLFLKEDLDVLQAFKTGWISWLDNNPRKWVECPAYLKSEAKVIQARKKGWIRQLENDTQDWDECPTRLQSETGIIQARKDGWVAFLTAHPERWVEISGLCRAELLSDFATCQRIRAIYALLPKKNAFLLSQIPQLLFLPPYAAASLAALAAEPRATLPVVQAWRHHPRMELANCQKALAALRHFPQNYDTLPPEQKEHALIRQAAALGWADWVQKTPEAASKVPAEFQDHPEVAEQVRRAFAKCLEMKLKQVEENPSITDEQLEHLAIPAANRKMRKTIREIRLKYWKAQVKKGWRNWSTMPPSLQQEEVVLKVMREGLGPEIRRAPGLWKDLPEGYRQDECLQRVHRYATRD